MIKLLHTGDVHLDSPFSGLPASLAADRRRQGRAVFTSMTTYARTENVDAFLIAGDLFDSDFVTRETLDFLSEELGKLDCPVFISPGNHDPYTEDSVWSRCVFPDNVFIFSSAAIQRYSLPKLGLDVYGYAFTSQSVQKSPLLSAAPVSSDAVSVLCAHGDMSSPISNYAPISKDMLAAFGADYAALGHIHNAEEYRGETGGCAYAYCGCPEGRSFDECGEKFALVVEIEKQHGVAEVRLRPKKFFHNRYETVSVNVDGAASTRDVIRMARDVCPDGDGSLSVRFELEGMTEPSFVLSKKEFTEAFPELFSVDVRDGTLPLWNGQYLENDLTVHGEVYRTLKPQLESTDEREREIALRAFRYAFAALTGNDISDL